MAPVSRLHVLDARRIFFPSKPLLPCRVALRQAMRSRTRKKPLKETLPKAGKSNSRKTRQPRRQSPASRKTGSTAAAKQSKRASRTAKPKQVKGTILPQNKPAEPVRHAAKVPALRVPIPPILLEGDQPLTAPPASAPRLGVERVKPAPTLEPAEGELPEAYGTGRLFLTPRDPRCLCAQWDLTAEQLRYHNARAADQHLALRVYQSDVQGERVAELHVHPDSRHWFVHVDRTGAAYIGELGYYASSGQWRQVAISEPVSTPSETPPPKQQPIQFARFVPEPALQPPIQNHPAPEPSLPTTTFPETPPSVAENAAGGADIARALEFPPLTPAVLVLAQATAPVAPSLDPQRPAAVEPVPQAPALRPPVFRGETAAPSPTQVEILRELTGLTTEHRQWLNSAEVAELVTEERKRAIFAERAVPLVSISSPGGAEVPSPKNFWFSVNAELIIYGATEPDAHVTIGERTIKLRPDGTFSYRFALPDGAYSLPITATAWHGDQRSAQLEFRRGTLYTGIVGQHPQDPSLKTPSVENVT